MTHIVHSLGNIHLKSWYLIVWFGTSRQCYQRWSRGHKARSQGQDQRHKKISRPRPRTDPLEAKAKDQGHRRKCSQKKRSSKNFLKQSQKKVFRNFFRRKSLQKFFFRRFPLEENKKRSTQIYCEVSGAFQQNFNGSKNSALLEPRTGQFSRT